MLVLGKSHICQSENKLYKCRITHIKSRPLRLAPDQTLVTSVSQGSIFFLIYVRDIFTEAPLPIHVCIHHNSHTKRQADVDIKNKNNVKKLQRNCHSMQAKQNSWAPSLIIKHPYKTNFQDLEGVLNLHQQTKNQSSRQLKDNII